MDRSRSRSLPLVLTRLASALSAGLLLVAALEMWGLARQRPEPSALLYGSLAVAVLGALVAVALAFAPQRVWLRLLDTIRRWRGRVESATVPQSRRVVAALFVIAAAAWVAVEAAFLSLPRSPEGNDQGAYLLVAQQVHDAGGMPALVRQLFTGEFAEANRHPLYIALLSLRPTFGAGTVLSVVIGTIALWVLSAPVARKFGPATGGVFAVLLATNYAFCYAASLVTCEGLLVLLTGLLWLTVVERRERAEPDGGSAGASRARERGSRSFAEAALPGALLGLAWLTKGTGLLLLAGFLVWKAGTLVVAARPELFARRLGRFVVYAAVVLIAAGIVASPLLVRNVQRFGSPLYNVNSYLLFTDEYVHPEELAREMSPREAAALYLETHTVGDMLRREIRGLAWEAFIIVRTFGPAPLDDGRVLLGGPLLLLALLGMGAERRRDALLVAIWLVLFLVVFAWYVPIAAGDRFVLPVVVPALAYSAAGFLRLLRLCAGPADRHFNLWLIGIALLWCAGWGAATWVWLDVRPS